MQTRTVALAIVILLSTVAVPAQQNGKDLYQQGLARETAGDLQSAIQIFERIVRDFSADRSLTAKALVQLGRWSDLLGPDQSRKYYERVIREFADQKEAADDARTRLDALARAGAHVAGASRRLVVDSTRNNSLPGRPTRDGRHLLRYNSEHRAFELTVIGSREVRHLTTDGPDPAKEVVGWSFEVSPNGRRLAAVVRVLKPGSPTDPPPLLQVARTELRVFEVGGRGTGRVLATWDEQALGGSYQPFAWARNDHIWLFGARRDQSAQIAFVNTTGHLEVLKTLTWRDTAQVPSLSPDGRWLAYHDAAGRQAPADLFVIATDGGSAHRLEHPADDSKPAFLPDGSGIVFESNRRGQRDLWFQAVSNGGPRGEPRLVWRDVGSFGNVYGFSDTGSLFFSFSGYDWGVYTVPLNLTAATGEIGSATRLTPVNNEPNSGAAFSPDGRYLAHFRANTRLVLRELATGLEREIPLGAQFSSTGVVDWCPNGDSLIAAGYITGTGGFAFRVNVKDASAQRLSTVENPYIPALCVGNGEDVILLKTSGNPWVRAGSILRRSLVSGRETTLYEGAFAPLARSMDARRLAFAASDSKGQRVLVTMSVDGGEVSPNVMPAGIRQPPQAVIYNAAWMPSGDRLLVDVREAGDGYDWMQQPQVPFSLWEVSLTGAPPRKLGLLPLPEVEGSFVGPTSFSMHPDGKRLAYQCHEGLVQQIWAIDNLFQFIKTGGGR